MRSRLVLLLLTVSVLFPQGHKGHGFFTLRSQSPVQQLRLGIQHHPPWTLAQGRKAIHVQHTWKNMWLYKAGRYRIDGEVHETIFRGAYGYSNRIELAAELPIRLLTGGVLDGLIEGFHDTFGYIQAGREEFPRNQFAVEFYNLEDGTSIELSETETGWQIGNVILLATYNLIQDKHSKVTSVLAGNLKLPTASTNSLFSNQAIDLGLSLGLGYSLSPLHLYYNVGFIYYGDNRSFGIELNQWHLSTLIAFEYRQPGSNHSWIFQGLVENGVSEDYEEFIKRTSELELTHFL